MSEHAIEHDALLMALHEMKLKVNELQRRVLETTHSGVVRDEGPPDMEEMRDTLNQLCIRQEKLESTFGVEKVGIRDVGDRVAVTIETNFGTLHAQAEKVTPTAAVAGSVDQQCSGGSVSPIHFSGSTGAVSPSGGVTSGGGGGGKVSGTPGMTSDQLQEFKKQSLQIGASQQKLKELETKLTEAIAIIKKSSEKTTDLEEKETENVKEIYTHIDAINSSLSEKIALQRVEVQKIAGDTPKPINYDPFNYGEAYAGDLVDFQARKRIMELKLLMQGLQTAYMQIRDQMKVSTNIDLGYKVVRLDQLIGSTGFAQKVNNGEVNADDVLLVEQSSERMPGKVEYPRTIMNQTSAGMESKWAITDSIMQTMYRLEMELGEIQKVVEGTGAFSGSKVLEEIQATLKHLKDKQLDSRMVKRLIEEAKDSSINLMNARKSQGAQRSTVIPIHSQLEQQTFMTQSKVEALLRQFQDSIKAKIRKGSTVTQKSFNATNPSALTRKSSGGPKSCLACDRPVKAEKEPGQPGASIPLYNYFSPTGAEPRLQGPLPTQFYTNRSFKIHTSQVNPQAEFNIPRPCARSYAQYWPVPASFDTRKYLNLVDPPPIVSDTRYIKGTDGKYYRSGRRRKSSASAKLETPISILSVKPAILTQQSHKMERGFTGADDRFGSLLVPGQDASGVAVVVMAASEEALSVIESNEDRMAEKDLEAAIVTRDSDEMKTYRFKMKDEDVADEEHETVSDGNRGTEGQDPAGNATGGEIAEKTAEPGDGTTTDTEKLDSDDIEKPEEDQVDAAVDKVEADADDGQQSGLSGESKTDNANGEQEEDGSGGEVKTETTDDPQEEDGPSGEKIETADDEQKDVPSEDAKAEAVEENPEE